MILPFSSDGGLYSGCYCAGVCRESLAADSESLGYQHFGDTIRSGAGIFHVRSR
jgi:hypothetical protein